MKSAFSIIIILLLAGCGKKESGSKEPVSYESEAQTEVERGRELFEGSGNCFACHKPDQKIIGPSIMEIAKIYKEQSGDIVAFLKGNEKPIVDPSQFEVMKTNFSITKNMSDTELNALEAYIYSFSQ